MNNSLKFKAGVFFPETKGKNFGKTSRANTFKAGGKAQNRRLPSKSFDSFCKFSVFKFVQKNEKKHFKVSAELTKNIKQLCNYEIFFHSFASVQVRNIVDIRALPVKIKIHREIFFLHLTFARNWIKKSLNLKKVSKKPISRQEIKTTNKFKVVKWNFRWKF